jgi:hypothetical protein
MVNPEELHMKAVVLEEDVFGAVIPGLGTAASGEASYRYLDCAIQLALNGEHWESNITSERSRSPCEPSCNECVP